MHALEIMEIEEAREVYEQHQENFRINDLEQANWALRKIAAYKKKQQEVDEIAKAELFRIQSWQERESSGIENAIAYFEGLLAAFLMERRAIDPKFKISTPYGKVTTRKQQPKWEYQDEEVLSFLKAIGATEYIRVKEEVNKADLKKMVKVEEDRAVIGDVVVPGIKITEQPEKVIVEVEK